MFHFFTPDVCCMVMCSSIYGIVIVFFFISDEANSIVGETSILSGLKAGEPETFGCNNVHPAGIFKGLSVCMYVRDKITMTLS